MGGRGTIWHNLICRKFLCKKSNLHPKLFANLKYVLFISLAELNNDLFATKDCSRKVHSVKEEKLLLKKAELSYLYIRDRMTATLLCTTNPLYADIRELPPCVQMPGIHLETGSE